MKSTCRLYIVCQFLKLLLIIIYNMQPPSLFISYLLFYISLFNGFTQGDRVVSCTKINLHHHYPLHLQDWTALKHILKEVWGCLSFVLDQSNPTPHKHKPNYLHPFLSTSLATSVNPQLPHYFSAVISSLSCFSAVTRRDAQLCFNLYFESDDLMLHVH